jgi:hypothetical protein
MAILHLIAERTAPYGIVAKLTGAVPSGSYLALSHVASDIDQKAVAEARERSAASWRSGGPTATGMQIVDPGIVPVQEWRPVSAAEAALPAAIWGGVGRKI